ncbi:MAG: OPT/YSL family transporter [Oscillospiraceae bacterium]|nr:OPT/YSL family transporter [Oscillospiraceae bacterium]
MNKERRLFGVEHLSLRSLIIGALGSAVLTASSMYAALRLGMVPWPNIFAAILALGVLKVLSKTSKNEVNVSQTAMTAGAMIAAGLGFTIPGLWMSGDSISMSSHFWIFLGISGIGLFMGIFLTWIWREMLLKKEKLPFPIGIATAKTIEAGDEGGKKTIFLLIALAVTAIFTVLRDWFTKIPEFLGFNFLNRFNIQSGIALVPFASAIGYMIGALYSFVLFIGGIFGFFLLVPIGIEMGWFADLGAANDARMAIGLGLMVGSGLGVILKFVFGFIKKIRRAREKEDAIPMKARLKRSRISLLICAIAFVGCVVMGFSPLVSALIIIGIFLATLMSSFVTGQTGICPLEIFGILVMIAIRGIVPNIGVETSLLIAGVVAIASGFVADVMFDYKTGEIFNTNPKAQLISQIVRRNSPEQLLQALQ